MKELFIELYAQNMRADSDKHPGRYMIPSDGWHGLATRMVEGLIAGRANLSDCARKTARQLGGTPTYAGVRALIGGAS